MRTATMLRADSPFEDYRLAAVRSFAQTMIVVDDEATQTAPQDKVSKLRRPRRLGQKPDVFEPQLPLTTHDAPTHFLDAKSLIDNAMELGLICSILRPRKGENVRRRVKCVARHADIVCLDWEIYGDQGSSAAKLIREIVLDDLKRNGRLRLIAIYTGDTTNIKILDKVFEALPERFRAEHELKQEPLFITSNIGLRIVCLFKAHGIQLPEPRRHNQVNEAALPARLQSEFATLAEGLLSNVALATIASIRGSTHHVLGKVTGEMDGPYFHHRAVLPNAVDAEEYAVDVVLSELKSAVDKQDVARMYAGPQALAARVREMLEGASDITLKFAEKGSSKTFAMKADEVVLLVKDGVEARHDALGTGKPGKRVVAQGITSIFYKDEVAAKAGMNQFAILTGVRSHPGSHRYKNAISAPPLGLGTVVQDPLGTFFLCLQASCDSVRLKKKTRFLFIPLDVVDTTPDHVVPVARKGKIESVGLAISRRSYATVVSIEFEPDTQTESVVATKKRRRQGFYFQSAQSTEYRWVANLKSRRALRTAQKLGQDMGRLGFDEFEPFRRKDD